MVDKYSIAQRVIEDAGITALSGHDSIAFAQTLPAIANRINHYHKEGKAIAKAHLLTTPLLQHIWHVTRNAQEVLSAALLLIQAHNESFYSFQVKFSVFNQLAEKYQFEQEKVELPIQDLQNEQEWEEMIEALIDIADGFS